MQSASFTPVVTQPSARGRILRVSIAVTALLVMAAAAAVVINQGEKKALFVVLISGDPALLCVHALCVCHAHTQN